MMTNQVNKIKQFLLKKTIHIATTSSIILLLFLPFYFWFLFSLYQTKIQTPQEWKQFAQQEKQINEVLEEFKTKNNVYPKDLSPLVPDYLAGSIGQSKKWDFHYDIYENGEFSLSANVPKSWFGWHAKRVCQSQQNEQTKCNFHFICWYKHGTEYLTDAIVQEQPSKPVFGNQKYPCINNT